MFTYIHTFHNHAPVCQMTMINGFFDISKFHQILYLQVVTKHIYNSADPPPPPFPHHKGALPYFKVLGNLSLFSAPFDIVGSLFSRPVRPK